MARNYGKTKTIVLREDNIMVPDRMPDAHRIWLAALLEACLDAGLGFYVGQWRRSGQVKLRLYAGDTLLETYLDAQDDPSKVILQTVEAGMDKAYLESVAKLATRRLAGSGGEGRK